MLKSEYAKVQITFSTPQQKLGKNEGEWGIKLSL